MHSLFTKYFFNKSSDFGISCDGCTTILSEPWHDVIHCAQVLMFFGKSFDLSRPWGPVFCFKSDPEYAHHVFRQFASEYFGDSRVSSQLFASYKECLCNYYRLRCINTECSSVRKQDLPTFNCDAARKFQLCFDNICRHSYFNSFSDFNDYSMPILSTADFLNFLNASKNIFPEQ